MSRASTSACRNNFPMENKKLRFQFLRAGEADMRNEWGATVNDKVLETAQETAQEASAVCEPASERSVAAAQGLDAIRCPEDLRRLDRSALSGIAARARSAKFFLKASCSASSLSGC